jgi:undecaprenyl-diphosphatase
MSTAGAERQQGRWAAYCFVALLALSVLWPAPVLWLNDATVNRPLSIDDQSFLGREAPSWDVVFWGVTGLFVLALLHGRLGNVQLSWRALRQDVRRISQRMRERHGRLSAARVVITLLISLLAIAMTWLFFDAKIVVLVESLQTPYSQAAVRLFNRLGGGMNPPMIVLFFLIAGLAFARTLWIELALSMALAGGGAGLLVQIVKQLVGRSRPELWLGPFHHTWPSATSFPSGHTVGAFALAGVLWFGSRSKPVRGVALLLAIGVGLSRIFAFRHWPSDVLASALIGTAVGWFFTVPLVRREESLADDLSQ